MIPTITPPRWAAWFVQALVAVGELAVRSCGLCGLVLAFCATTAHAAGTLIPERVDALCARLGKAADCSWSTDGHRLRGALTIAVGDTTAEPGAMPAWEGVHASVLTFTVRPHGPTLTKLVQINDGATLAEYAWYLGQAPCLEAYPLCRERRESEAGYLGPQRSDLLDEAAVLTKLLLQLPDDDVIAELQRLAGSQGVPYVSAVGRRTALWTPTHGSVATTRTLDITIRFAVP